MLLLSQAKKLRLLVTSTAALAFVYQKQRLPSVLYKRTLVATAKKEDLITSTANRIVKEARILHSRRGRLNQKLVLLEGVRLITESAKTCEIDTLVLAEDLRIDLEARRIVRVTDRVLKACADTSTPQGAIAFARPPKLVLRSTPSLILACDNISDPGNLGALVRTAAAAGVDAVLLVGSQSCDHFSPKALRAAMGAAFRLPLYRYDSWTEAMNTMQTDWNLCIRAADLDPRSSIDHDLVDWTLPSALIVGAEIGLTDTLRTLLDEHRSQDHISRVHIPIIHGAVESLNAAVAGSAILLEARRQRLRST